MSYHAAFTLTKIERKKKGLSKNERYIWYYYTYTPDGVRVCRQSTHCTSRAQARLFCEDLLRRGLLYKGENQTFAQYANSWFDESSPYMQDRMATGTKERPALAQSTIQKYKNDLRLYLLKYFGDKKINEIKPSDVKHFRTWMLQEKKMSAKSVNNAISTFKIIIDYALADNIIMFDPLRGIKPLITNPFARDAFSLQEAKNIFSAEWKSYETRLFNLISACTGMRESEIMAIRKETLHENYIDVKDQYYDDGLHPVKTKEARKVPIVPMIYDSINKLCINDFAFHEKDFQRPYIHLRYVMRDLQMEDERKKRNLCFHSWRHFFETQMLAVNVPEIKVKSVMGHSSGAGSMQERYTSWQPEMFPEIYAAQNNLWNILNNC